MGWALVPRQPAPAPEEGGEFRTLPSFTPAPPVDHSDRFRECMENFGYAASQQAAAAELLGNCRSQLNEVTRQMSDIEAEIMNNAGYDTVVIDGKNAETRVAQLTLACGKHPAFIQLRETRAALERDIARAQAHITDADNDMRRCRLIAEQITAETYRSALRMPIRTHR